MERDTPTDLTDLADLLPISGGQVYHLPIVKAFADRIDLVGTINRLVDSEAEVDPGTLTLALVEDALSGRHPLYRVREFFEGKDLELLLGKPVALDSLSDDNFGRLLDRLYQANTSRLLSALAVNAFGAFGTPTPHIHFDTTSVSLYGAYDPPEDEPAPPFQITHGFSKDRRPDLKQFLVSLLCVGGTLPSFSKLEDGNASDKAVNHAVLATISQKLAEVGIRSEAAIYIADSALVTEANLEQMGSTTLFITRLPATYAEHDRVVRQAVAADQWTDFGPLARTPAPATRPPASYRGYETTLTLYGSTYRALVVHSTSHDRRRQKRLDRQLAKERKALQARADQLAKTDFACRPDAEAAAEQLRREPRSFYDLDVVLEERPRYARGRPKADGTRTLRQMRYGVRASLVERPQAIASARQQAGCFVLLTNVPPEGPEGSPIPYDGRQLLVAYKDQHGIEKNFGFLKDPAIVNAIFLKRPERIEALGFILVVSLLLWRLIEAQMRRHVADTGSKLPGWDNKPTDRPTTFMLTTKFESTTVFTAAGRRFFGHPLSQTQHAFLRALGLTAAVFTHPHRPRPP
jgi:transposase